MPNQMTYNDWYNLAVDRMTVLELSLAETILTKLMRSNRGEEIQMVSHALEYCYTLIEIKPKLIQFTQGIRQENFELAWDAFLFLRHVFCQPVSQRATETTTVYSAHQILESVYQAHKHKQRVYILFNKNAPQVIVAYEPILLDAINPIWVYDPNQGHPSIRFAFI